MLSMSRSSEAPLQEPCYVISWRNQICLEHTEKTAEKHIMLQDKKGFFLLWLSSKAFPTGCLLGGSFNKMSLSVEKRETLFS